MLLDLGAILLTATHLYNHSQVNKQFSLPKSSMPTLQLHAFYLVSCLVSAISSRSLDVMLEGDELLGDIPVRDRYEKNLNTRNLVSFIVLVFKKCKSDLLMQYVIYICNV